MVLTTPESIIEQASTQKLLDDLIDESTRTSARRPIMMQFDPSSGGIWKRWKGTIFSETWDSCVSKMVYAILLLVICHSEWGLLQQQRWFHQFLHKHLQGFNVLWGQMLQVTTFTLTFFLNQAYALWRKCYAHSRRIQGRLHDINMFLSAHAARKPPASPSDTSGSTHTAASRQLLELVSRYARLFNLLTYASFTRSHRPILTPRGMRRLVERGLLTPHEREVLVSTDLPATQRHNAVLLWITRAIVEGWDAGHLEGGPGFENQVLEQIHLCRAQYGAIGDELSGRMPLAYAHIVQVLVDVVLWMYPLMAISSSMSPMLAVLGTGILTISYQGLFDLAKQFLDPYDNESFGKGEDPLVVDTLIAETNAGSVRWMNGLAEFPISSQRLKDGALSEYTFLPQRGYSVKDLERMEAERLERERELQERREKEDEEMRQKQEKARQVRKAAEAMIPALYVEKDYNLKVLEQEFVPDYELEASETTTASTRGAVTVLGQEREQKQRASTQISYLDTLSQKGGAVNGAVPEMEAVSLLSLERDLLPISALSDVSMDLGNGVAKIVNQLDDIAGGVPQSLIPPETAAAKQETPAYSSFPTVPVSAPFHGAASDNSEPEETTAIPEEMMNIEAFMEATNGMETVVGNGEDGVDSEVMTTSSEGSIGDEEHKQEDEHVDIDDEEEDEEELYDYEDMDQYEHVFDFQDHYKDLQWFDEYDADGKEIRLSQIMADEEWEEELQAAREKKAEETRVRTFEQYTRRIEEIRDAATNELAETQEILEAAPNDESSNTIVNREDKQPPKYDQTKLDGISQLWGLGPGEISESWSYQEPALDESDDSFDGLMQLSGESRSSSQPWSADKEDDSTNFEGLQTLWGTSFEDSMSGESRGDTLSPSATRPINDYREVPRWGTEEADASAFSMSQMLADEVWEEEIREPEPEPVVNPITLEDYEKQITEIMEAEKEEMEETEAILNAPAFAESLEGYHNNDDDSSRVQASNNTTEANDDLAVLEMDVVDVEEDSGDQTPTEAVSTSTVVLDDSSNDADVAAAPTDAETSNEFLEENAVDPLMKEESKDLDEDEDNPPDLNIIR